METQTNIVMEVHDLDESHLIFSEFLFYYRKILEKSEEYLENMIQKTSPAYAVAYMPWRDAIHDILVGCELLSRKTALPDKEGFINAVRMFSFDSSLNLLNDICKMYKIRTALKWESNFRNHIEKILSPNIIAFIFSCKF